MLLRSRLRRRVAVLLATLTAAALPTGTAFADAATGLGSDGVWCWFSDPRAFCHDGILYTGWVTKFGDIQAVACRLNEGQTTTFELETAFGPDDRSERAHV